uniref:Geranylgeranyl transferase type-1 subunit beta n=1 Tax=Arcella intermedia TaxID=1963864 RepID=A0A6B2L8R2_9EUKA
MWSTHLNYLKFCLNGLPGAFGSMDPNRLTLAYFVVSSLDLLDKVDTLPKQQVIDWVYSLQIIPDSEKSKRYGGWRGGTFVGAPFDCSGKAATSYPYDQGHIAMTYVALALLLILGDDFSRVDKKAIIEALPYLQQPSGSFSPVADESECDMRYVYCAAAVSYMLNDWSGFDKDKATQYILSSQSYDYGIAQAPNEEAHGGSTYCALASLALMGRLDELPHKDKLTKWLIFRQEQGFNGRPNKIQDTCYSFWVGASLKILGAYHLVDEQNTRKYTLSCQKKNGGFAKWSSQSADPLHSYFSLCGLTFINEPGLAEVLPELGFSKKSHDRLLSIHPNFISIQK